MSRLARTLLPVTLLAALLVVVLGVVGCAPPSSSALDEEREPHFRTGKSRLNSLDYAGAIEAFEKALEVNPHSASAHFELGLLYEGSQEQDYAAAIYHYDRYLKLRPNAENAEIIRSHAQTCKQAIASTVLLAPVQQNMQRDLERATEENRQLRQKLDAWQAFYSNNVSRLNAGPGPVITQPSPNYITPPTATPRSQPVSQSPNVSANSPNSGRVMVTPLPAPRNNRPTAVLGTYTIKSGDTPASVARKYGVKLDALLAANPGLDAKHLRQGQVLSIPAR